MGLGASGQRLHLRLFLEGVEIPVISAQVQVNINAPATASIEVIPSDRLLEIKPRSMVHLFFWDYSNDLPGSQDLAGAGLLTGYKLLYSGEVIGTTYMKTPYARQAVFQCADFSTYWDTTYQLMVTYGKNGNFLNESSAAWAGGNSMFNDILDGHASVLNGYLKRSPVSEGLQNVKGLAGGIIALLEAMGGVANHTRGVNDFFTIAELKNHLMQQIVAEENDDTAQRLFDSKVFMEWLTRGLTSLGELVTFRDMLKMLFKYIYYEVVPIPSPLYVRGENSKTVLTTKKIAARPAEDLADGVQAQIVTQRDLCAFNGSTVASAQAIDIKAVGSVTTVLYSLTRDDTIPARVIDKINVAVVFLNSIQSAVITTGFDPLKVAANRDNWQRAADALSQALAVGKVKATKASTKTALVKTKPKLDRMFTQVVRPDCFFASPPRSNVLFPEQVTSFTYSRNFLQEITRLRLSTSDALIGSAGGLFANLIYAPNLQAIRDIAKKQGASGIRALLPWEKFTGIIPKFESMSEINYIANKRERQIGKKLGSAAVAYGQRAANFNYFKYRFASRTLEVGCKFNPYFIPGFPALVIDKPFSVSPELVQSALGSSGSGNPVSGDLLKNVRALSQTLQAPTQYLGMAAGMSHTVNQQGGQTSLTLTHGRSHRVTDDDFITAFTSEITANASQRTTGTVLNAKKLLAAGDVRLLKFLIDATPQDISSAAPLSTPSDAATPTLASRPTGLPSPSQTGPLGQLVIDESIAAAIGGISAVNVQADSGTGSFRGPTAEGILKGGRAQVLEPSPYGKLRVGSRGPNGGIVTQVTLDSDNVLKLSSDAISGFTFSPGSPLSTPSGAGSGGSKFVWESATIYETVKGGKIQQLIPPEEAIRPPWFSPLYSNFFIGDEIYQKFFGVGSIVDNSIFLAASGLGSFGVDRAKQSEFLGKLRGADGDTKKIAQIVDDAKKDGTLLNVPDIESSVDALAYVYANVRQQGLDIHRFVQDYTYRPIATLAEVLGSDDLTYELDSSGKQLSLVTGVPGFHSTAIVPPPLNEKLLGLLDNPDAQLPRLKPTGKKGPISQDLDPRPDRREKALAYATAISASTGTLGIGLSG